MGLAIIMQLRQIDRPGRRGGIKMNGPNILAAIREPQRFQKLILVGPSPCYINDGDYVGGFTRGSIDELLERRYGKYRAIGMVVENAVAQI